MGAETDGCNLAHRVVGDAGPWIALVPGGRRSHDELLPLAERISALGFRVLLHDRRGTGASPLVLSDAPDEEASWVDDLGVLLDRLGICRVVVGGFSSGCRVALRLARARPDLVAGLTLCRVTGGATAARRLPWKYYGQYVDAARSGGMPRVLGLPDMAERLVSWPEATGALLDVDPSRFVSTMERWQEAFELGVGFPVLGVSPLDLARVTVPVVVVPGNDLTHSYESGLAASEGIPDSRLVELPVERTEREIIPFAEWKPHEERLAGLIAELASRALRPQTFGTSQHLEGASREMTS